MAPEAAKIEQSVQQQVETDEAIALATEGLSEADKLKLAAYRHGKRSEAGLGLGIRQ